MRAIAGFIAVLLIAGAAVFLADRPGAISIDWQGWRIDTSVAGGILILVIAVFLLWLVLSIIKRLISAPRHYTRRRREVRILQGYRAVTLGLVAIAGGDGGEAERQRLRGERAFKRSGLTAPPLTRLLAAQAALLRGDEASAKGEFSAMLGDNDLAFLGLRGLIVQAVKDNDDHKALELIERAKRLKPGSSWVLQTELALEARSREWRQASETLRAAVKQGAISSQSGRNYEITLLVARSRQAIHENRLRDALTFATQAAGLDNSFAPAVASYARALTIHKKPKKALRAIETAWSKQPHPELSAAYADLLTEETPALKFRHFERLVELRPNVETSHLAAATVALDAKLWGEARRHLDCAGASSAGPWSQTLCRMMAELERLDHADTTAVELWQSRLRYSAPDPAWICEHCGGQSALWEPVCSHCQGFGTLNWGVPASSAGRLMASNAVVAAIESPLTSDTVVINPLGSPAPGGTARRVPAGTG